MKRRIDHIFTDHYHRFLQYIKSSVDEAESEDILQEVYCKIADGIDILAPVENVLSYIFKSIRNKIIDRKRKEKKLEPFDEVLFESNQNPDILYEQKEIIEIIEEALAKLPREQQDIFIATEFDNYTFKEFAQQTGESINTLLSRKRYAVSRLKKELSRRLI